MANVKSQRRQQARATRESIIAAAHVEFVEHGFHGTTVAAIAERAGVSEQTVYFVFHTKANLISAVIDSAVMGTENPTTPQEQPWWAEMLEEPDPATALRIFIRGAGPLFARASGVAEALRAAAMTDDELSEIYERHQSIRREGYGAILDDLATKGSLRSGLSRDQLRDIFFLLYGDATYQLLTTEMGWSHEDVIDWLCTELPRLLFEPAD